MANYFTTPKKKPRNAWILIIVGVLVLSAAGYVGWQWYANSQAPDQEAEVAPTLMNKLSDLETNARTNQDVDELDDTYQELINAAEDDVEKRRVLISKADANYLSGRYEEAKKTAEEADAISRGKDSVEILAEVNAVLGDNEEARRYFLLAVEEAKKANEPYEQYEVRIRGLE